MIPMLHAVLIAGAVLDIRGPDARINFGGATLRASCDVAAPFVRAVSPLVIGHSHGNVTMHLVGVATTCANSQIDEPCASEDDAPEPDEHLHPALFSCAFTGLGGSDTTGPVRAHTQLIEKHNQPVSIAVFITCPLPTVESIINITKYAFDGATSYANVSLMHGDIVSGDDPMRIPFRGVRGGSSLSFTALPAPPPPPESPPLLPPAPPPKGPNVECSGLALVLTNDNQMRDCARGRGGSQTLSRYATATERPAY